MKAPLELLGNLFKRIFSTRVSFDDGSYIEFLNREAIVYAEQNGHRMEIVWYFQPGRVKGRVLRVTDISHWDSPHEAEQLSPQKKDEIQQKVVEYSHKRNIPLEIRKN